MILLVYNGEVFSLGALSTHTSSTDSESNTSLLNSEVNGTTGLAESEYH